MHLTKLTYQTPSGKPHQVANIAGRYLTDQEELQQKIFNIQLWLETSYAVKRPIEAQEKRAELNKLLKKVKND